MGYRVRPKRNNLTYDPWKVYLLGFCSLTDVPGLSSLSTCGSRCNPDYISVIASVHMFIDTDVDVDGNNDKSQSSPNSIHRIYGA